MKTTGILVFMLVLVLLFESRTSAQTNLALKATASTSYVSSWEKLGAVNDGKEPTSSSVKPGGVAYGNWNGDASFNIYSWVQYEWPLAQKLDSTRVYWWDDGGGIKQPTDSYIEYWDGAAWKKAGQMGTALNKYNALGLKIQTNKIRIYMISPQATGILEWQVWGAESGPCDPSTLATFVKINNSGFKSGSSANVLIGDSLKFKVEVDGAGSINWTGPGGFSSTSKEISLLNLRENQAGTYSAIYMNECGAFTTKNFSLTVFQSMEGDAYSWPSYSPTLNYNFRQEFPALDMPTQDLDDCPQVVGTKSSGWWTFKWGPNANTLVTEAAIIPMLERMNTDFAYFRDVMGWPPDKRAKRGYRSAIYLYGSGLCTDNAKNTDLGGWQSAISYKGESWPMVLLSYYPVYSFDPACKYSDKNSQMGACVHEGIHSVLADLPGCKNAAWFHEGGNTWLQQEMESKRSNSYSSMGFLNAATFIAPFMPIECYSGWLQDDSFGGPSAEGVNMFNGGQQICTWRNLLGGNQYGNVFPTFLGQTLGIGSVPWIWRYCKSRVLEGIADSLGENQTRKLIMEYRAKQALLDFKEWTGAVKNLVSSNFKVNIKAEWQPSWLSPAPWTATPYAKTTSDGKGLLTPEYRTTPGWSGANQIPLLVSGDTVVVDFQPIGANMSCQLCYRTKTGETVYSQPVFAGECRIKLEKKPANGVVFAVISNTDYKYLGEVTRKAHYDYRLQLVKGVKRTANIHLPWFDWTKTINDTGNAVEERQSTGSIINRIYPNPANGQQRIHIELRNIEAEPVTIEINTLSGQKLFSKKVDAGRNVEIDSSLSKGLYFLSASVSGQKETQKILVN